MLERWTRAVVRQRVIVIVLWAVVVAVGVFSTVRLPGLLSTSLTVPGSGSEQANAVLTQRFGENIEGTFTVVLREGSASAGTVRTLGQRLALAANGVPTGRASRLQRGEGILYGDIASSLDLQRAAAYTGALRSALTKAGLPGAYVTGAPAVQHDLSPVLAADLHVGELIAVLVALIFLTLALGPSLAVLLPFVVALCTTTGALAIVYGLAHEFLMVLYVPNLVQLIGLGLAVDYSLLIVHRFRGELLAGTSPVEDVIVRTMATAGRTVVLSGVAVAIGLCVLLFVPVPFVRSLGVAGFLVPIMSVLAALSLQPALLSVLGRQVLRGAWLQRLLHRHSSEGGLWSWLAHAVVRRPLAALACSTAVLVAAAAPVAWLQLTPASVTAVPRDVQADQGLALLRDRAGPGVVTPIEVVLDSGRPGGALKPAVSAATLRLAHELVDQPEVFVVAIGNRPPYVDASSRYRRTVVIERDDFGDEASQLLVYRIRAQLLPAAHFPAGTRVTVGGAPAQGVDFLARTYGGFPWVVLVVAGLAYIILLRAFRSLLLPLMAVLLDALSVAASYGLLVVVFRFGVGADVFGLYRAPQIEGWAPVFLFAMLFGLSMDYEVFFVTRMRESWDKGADNKGAVVDGLTHTGRVVSVAAVVMVGALTGLVAGRVAGLQELGAGLALGVLLDATVVRGLLMPSLMALAGRWNWWLPEAVARAARAEASPLAARCQSDQGYEVRGGAGSSSSATRGRPLADPLPCPASEGSS
jgi:RND superfamily putative drug exporter